MESFKCEDPEGRWIADMRDELRQRLDAGTSSEFVEDIELGGRDDHLERILRICAKVKSIEAAP